MPDGLPADRAAPDPELLTLVIPVYNEEDSLPVLTAEIAAVVGPLGKRWEILFVDDGSTDGSWQTIHKLTQQYPEVRGLRFRRNFGKAAALQAGFTASRGGIVFTLDADLQDDPQEIPRFLAALDAGKDVVSGWKQVRHDPWHKVFPSRVFNKMISTLTGVHLHDHNCGFKSYRAAVVREVRLYGELHRFVPVLADAHGFRVGELVVHHRPRQFGHSKFGVNRFLKGFLDLLSVTFNTQYGRRPMHLLGGLGLCGLAGGVLGGLLLLVNLLFLTWTAQGVGIAGMFAVGLCSAVSFLVGVQCVLAGIVAELLTKRTSQFDNPYQIAETTPNSVSPGNGGGI
ncbi:MAG: glycosyltransferase family 2 protein [Bacteroidales bacterium]|nr:glycosyltransferase family 2 protein [Bacteroidales bacterium]